MTDSKSPWPENPCLAVSTHSKLLYHDPYPPLINFCLYFCIERSTPPPQINFTCSKHHYFVLLPLSCCYSFAKKVFLWGA